MQHKVFAIRDIKASHYKMPIYATHVAEVTRGLEKVLNGNEESMYASHPHDFELYQLGLYETDNATFELFEQPQHVLNFIDLKHQTMGNPAPTPQEA